MIPKTIHYCWFGGNQKSVIIERCIASWKEYCPDYEIIEWNESNFDVNCIPYTAAAYAEKKWAFVSDYARLRVVYLHGGIYLDTGVLLHNRIDDLTQYDIWFAQEEIRWINTGLGFGAVAKHPLLAAMMETYETSDFTHKVNGTMDMAALENYLHDWHKSPCSQLVNDVYIVGMNDYGRYARHLATTSWADEKRRKARLREINDYLDPSFGGKIRNFFRFIGWKAKCIVRMPAIVSFFDARKDHICAKIYTFFAYDLLEYGLLHYFRLIFRKVRNLLFRGK
jgi:hypothetical protein